MGVYRRPPRSDELYHFGVLGMKWGVRRYQNPDGSLTPLGRKRLAKDMAKSAGRINSKYKASDYVSSAQKKKMREYIKRSDQAYSRYEKSHTDKAEEDWWKADETLNNYARSIAKSVLQDQYKTSRYDRIFEKQRVSGEAFADRLVKELREKNTNKPANSRRIY